jgi:arabinan endo-1,5-alpha-L-arabinosidase
VFKNRGQWWIAFGPLWDGIKLQRLADLSELVGEIHSLARRHPDVGFNPIENPQIFRKGKNYLLTSRDFCCQGVDSTDKVAVGRSTSVTGPYVDRDGVPLTEGGGTVILEGSA